MTHRHDIIRAADDYAAAFAKNPCADACTDARGLVVQAVGLLEARCERLRELVRALRDWGPADRFRDELADCICAGDLEE